MTDWRWLDPKNRHRFLDLHEPWRDAMRSVSDDIDDEFGELLRITPCIARPNYQAEPDPARPPYLIRGVFRDRYATGLGQHGGVRVDSRAPQVSFDRDCLRYPPEQGMRVTRRQGDFCGDDFEVTTVEPDGVSRIVCHLNQLGRQDGL